MDVQNVLIEHWPRLQCANFFILFTKVFADVSGVRVCLKPTYIAIDIENGKTISIELDSIDLQIQVNSLSLLIVKHNLISFRANTNSNGIFQRELLNIPKLPIIPNTLVKLPITIEPNHNFYIVCNNCVGPLTDALNFRRVLELPSENMDLSEWYCHKPMTNAEGGGVDGVDDDASDHSHHHQHAHDNESDSPKKFNYNKFHPRQDDLLYGNFFALFHMDNFKNMRIDEQTKLIHCHRCLQHIGEILRRPSVKIWNCNVKIRRLASDCTESYGPLFNGDTIYENFLFILKKILIDFEMVVAAATQTQRIIFEAQSFDGTTRFLFIHIMSKNQNLFKMAHIEEDTIRLTSSNGMKVLFRCESNENQALLRFWQNDVNVINSQISIEMFECVLDKLHEHSKFVPETFRENNGFYLSYIFKIDQI